MKHQEHSVEPIPKVSIVILNWNGCDDTLECLGSIANVEYQNFEVIVVDNGSTDNSVEQIQKKFPSVTLLQTHKNLGYAGGNNFGIRHALASCADYVLILNNDTIVARNILTVFVQAAKTNSTGAVFGAKIYFYDEPSRIWCTGGEWSNENLSLQLVGFGQADDLNRFGRLAEIDIVVGCAFFARASMLQLVGLFDERFFLVHEESDWCFRAKRSGYNCFFVPEARVWHKVAASFGGQASPIIQYFNTRNTLLWAEKYLSGRQRFAVCCRVLGQIRKEMLQCVPAVVMPTDFKFGFLRTLYWANIAYLRECRKRWQSKRSCLRASFGGLSDYVLRRFGDCPRSIRSL
jgi:GT2 family glycosyltransferase